MAISSKLVFLLLVAAASLLNVTHGKSFPKVQAKQQDEKPILRFNSEGKLKIVNFSDLHYGEFPGTEHGNTQDRNSSRVMTNILDIEKPDFVVFTGDFITGETPVRNSTGYIRNVFAPLVERNCRWASTYGTHDTGIATTREDIFYTESQYNLSYTQHGLRSLAGLTNYYLPIYPKDERAGETPIFILWFFDSRGGVDPTGFQPSYVDETVVEWFISENANITERWGKLPALAYFHTPTLEYEAVQADMGNRLDCVGLARDSVVTQDRDTKLMDALVNSGTVLTTFVGHDHGNAWCCEFKTLQLCYNRHTGYGGLGESARGARVVELDSNINISDLRNYIRLENGTIIDEYPAPSGN